MRHVNGTYQNIAKNKMAAICITEAITMQRGDQERKYCCQIPHFQGQEIHWRLFQTPLNVNKLTNLRFFTVYSGNVPHNTCIDVFVPD